MNPIGAIITGLFAIIIVMINRRFNKLDKRMDKRDQDCEKELAEMREEYKKAIQLAIEQNKKL